MLAIENLMECKIVALAISPFYYSSEWHMFSNKKTVADIQQINEFKIKIRNILGVDAYTVGTDDIEDLVNTCIKYLSE